MSDWEEDYEDDFEDELSSRRGASSPSVPRTHTTPSPRIPPTAVAPAYSNNNYKRPSLESSFDSYESSGIANGGNNGNVLFANSARELSTPTSTLASSRHSDPTYPTEQPRRAASEQSHKAAYPTNAPLPTSIATSATSAAPSAPVSSYDAAPQMGIPQRQSNAYASETSAPAFSAHEGTGGTAAPPGRVSGKPSSSAYTDLSSSASSSSSDDSRRASSGKRDQSSAAYSSASHTQQQQQQHRHTPSNHVGAERDSVSLVSAGKQSESDTPATPSGTGAAAMLVSTPTTRNVSAPRPTSMNDANSNKKRAIYQSNYTTVEELDDDPLPQYRGGDGAVPTMVDEELSSEEDSEASDDRSEEQQQQDTYPAQHNNNLEGTAALEPEAELPTPQPPLPQLRQDDEEEPHYTAPSATSSRASSPTASQAYSDNFTAVTSHVPPSAHATPLASIRSAASSFTASTPPRPVLPVPTPTRTPPSPVQHAPPRRPTIPALEASLDSAAKNLTAPYSAERPRQAPQRNSRTPSTASAASSVSRASRKSSNHDGGDRDGALRAQLLLRITELHADIAAWDNRLARKQAAMAELEAPTPAPATSSGQRRGRSRSDGARSAPQQQPQQPSSRRTSKSPQPAAARRSVSNGRGRGRAGGGAAAARGGRGAARGGGNGKNAPVTQARLDALREANAKLEAAFVRYGGDGDDAAAIDVQTLVTRADAQLQRARARLKEVNAAKRALENRDKRAAHTIEEVHRRMPSTTELQDRQLNEGIYARTGLQRTARELRANIDRTRAATQLMESRCAELATQVEQQHLSSITPKDYEALRATRDTRKKTVERHRAAIAVYSAAVGQQDGRGFVAGTPMSAGGGGGGGPQSSPSSRTTSPRKSSRAGARSSLSAEEKRALVDYEVAKATQLAEQQVELVNKKAELQARIDELMRKVQQRNAQIQANHSSGAGVYYVGGGSNPSSTDPPPPLTSAAAGSGAAAVRKSSLRNVLETPAAKTANQRTSPSPARQRSTAAATPTTKDTETALRERSNATRNSAAAERLRGAVAAARQNGKVRASGSHAPPLRDLLPAEPQPQAVKVEKPLPSTVGTGQRTVRGAPLPSSSALTALADSPRKHAAPWDTTPESVTSAADAHAIPSYGYDENDTVEEKMSVGRATPSHASHSHTSVLGVESTAANDIDDEDDGGIEAMLRKIDEDNRRIGEEVFGRASPSPPHTEQLHQPSKHDDNMNALGGAVQASRDASEAYDEVDEVLEEEVVEAGEGSGRSTPDWLRAI